LLIVAAFWGEDESGGVYGHAAGVEGASVSVTGFGDGILLCMGQLGYTFVSNMFFFQIYLIFHTGGEASFMLAIGCGATGLGAEGVASDQNHPISTVCGAQVKTVESVKVRECCWTVQNVDDDLMNDGDGRRTIYAGIIWQPIIRGFRLAILIDVSLASSDSFQHFHLQPHHTHDSDHARGQLLINYTALILRSFHLSFPSCSLTATRHGTIRVSPRPVRPKPPILLLVIFTTASLGPLDSISSWICCINQRLREPRLQWWFWRTNWCEWSHGRAGRFKHWMVSCVWHRRI